MMSNLDRSASESKIKIPVSACICCGLGVFFSLAFCVASPGIEDKIPHYLIILLTSFSILCALFVSAVYVKRIAKYKEALLPAIFLCLEYWFVMYSQEWFRNYVIHPAFPHIHLYISEFLRLLLYVVIVLYVSGLIKAKTLWEAYFLKNIINISFLIFMPKLDEVHPSHPIFSATTYFYILQICILSWMVLKREKSEQAKYNSSNTMENSEDSKPVS